MNGTFIFSVTVHSSRHYVPTGIVFLLRSAFGVILNNYIIYP